MTWLMQTPLRISVPETVRVQNVDLTNELQTLIYFIEHYGQQLGDNGNDDENETED